MGSKYSYLLSVMQVGWALSFLIVVLRLAPRPLFTFLLPICVNLGIGRETDSLPPSIPSPERPPATMEAKTTRKAGDREVSLPLSQFGEGGKGEGGPCFGGNCIE